jgi:ribosome assembly protein YihI (activator of Der GTPase)
MSRTKKVRSTGNDDVVIVRQRSESDVVGRLRKKTKKHKGLKSGTRHSSSAEANKQANGGIRDPRLGSKKKIPLIVEPKKKATKAERLVLAEQELAQIENDAQFNVLLERLDNGEKLGAGLQSYVDKRLDRIEILMKALGIDTGDFDDEDEYDDDESEIVVTTSKKSSKKLNKSVRDDDDLLSDFEDVNLDEWKG